MNTKHTNWLNTLLFPGSCSLYLFLSFLCLFFYFFFFGRGVQYYSLNGKEPNWEGWFIFAIYGYVFLFLSGISKNWWNYRFLIVGTIIISVIFFSLQIDLHHSIRNKILGICCSAMFSSYLLCEFFKSKEKGKILWILPIIEIAISCLTDNIQLLILVSIAILFVLVIVDTNFDGLLIRIVIALGLSIFYIVSVLNYYPYYPMLSFLNIQSYGVSYQPRIASLVVDENGKYVIVNGSSLKGNRPIPYKFDNWKYYSKYDEAFVGFKRDRFKQFECKPIPIDIRSNLYPVIVGDSCIYFTSQVNNYKILNNYKESNNKIYSLTSLILYDFIECYQNYNEHSLDKLKKHQLLLQEEFNTITVDSLQFATDDNSEKKLKEFSQRLSLGILNALCCDLISNNDLNSAINVFSYQFCLTFFDTLLYAHKNINFNVIINRIYDKYSHSISFLISDKDLKRDDTFEPWVKMSSMGIAFAEYYLSEFNEKKMSNKLPVLRNILNDFDKSSVGIFDKNKTIALKKQINIIQTGLSDYDYTPALEKFVTIVQNFLFHCVMMNYLPDYNSYFLNRFNEITPMLPMSPKIVETFNKMSTFYSDKFNQDIKNAIDIRKSFDMANTRFIEAIELQDSIEREYKKLNLSPRLDSIIKEYLRDTTMSKQ